jgi:hypothetical protein
VSSGFVGGRVDGRVDVSDFETVGYTAGLSAGLAKALADLDDADLVVAAHGGYAAVPAQRVPDGATVVEHRMATSEGVAILDVRLPPGLVPMRHPGDRPEVVGLRLAAVRIGLARKLLDHAIGSLTDSRSPARHRVNLGALTDVRAALESLRRYLEGTARRPSRAAVADLHTRLTRLDWQVAKLFGPRGYLTDHPVRALFVAELVANTWVGT